MATELKRRDFLNGIMGLAALSFGGCLDRLNSNTKITSRPNIVFLLTDDQRNDTLGCAGHPIIKTPVIDSLATDGVRFSNAFVTTSICAASRASILTGLYERTHGFTFGTEPIKQTYISESYPALMRKAGYRTGFIGKYGVKTQDNLESEMFDFFKPHGQSHYSKGLADGTVRHETDLAGDRAIEFFNSNPENQPFCLSISFNAAHAIDGDKEHHYPWPKGTNGMYEDVKIPAPRLSEPSIYKNQPDFLKNSINRKRYFWRWDTPEKYQKNMKAYFRMISGIDQTIGRIRNELEKRGLAEDTVIIYMGDNGYYMGDRGFAGKWSHYEQSLRVPLIIYDPRLPRSKRGKVNKQMALNIDVTATMLNLAKIKQPQRHQGIALTKAMLGKGNLRDEFFCEHLMKCGTAIPKWEGIRTERYVYAQYFEQKPVYEFLHDLKIDPDQLKNFASAPEYKDILMKMRTRCNELKDKYIKAKAN